MTARVAALAGMPAEGARRTALPVAIAFGGVLVGALAVVSPLLAIGLLVGLGFVVVAFRNLAAGVAFFVVLTFFERLPGSATSGLTLVKLAGFVLALAWLATLATRRTAMPLLFRDHPFLAYAAVTFIGWSLASMLWAPDPVSTQANTLRLAQNVIFFMIVFSAIQTRRHLFWILWAYLGGALLTAIVGLAGGSSSEEFGPYADVGRLSGGIGDPNELAALLVPALAIGAFLIPATRSPLGRWLLVMQVLVCALALFFTQSRGGLLALGVLIVVVPWLAGPVRFRALVVILAIAALGIGYYALIAPPQALEHVTRFSVGSGTGREDLWKVSVEMFNDHPLAGVGTGNFQVVEPRYATQNIDLPRADLIVDFPKVAHNMYLHVLTELGIIGMAAFSALILGPLVLALRGVRNLARRGERSLEIAARGVLVGTLGMLAAFVFLTAQYEKQLWLMLALCTALCTLGRVGESEKAA